MDDLRCIVYVSSANWPLSEQELENILLDARRFNEENAITGVLLYNDGSFFQYIEGRASELFKVYDRIQKSRQHKHIIELLDTPISHRYFAQWFMGFFEPTESELLKITNADWSRTALDRILPSGPGAPAGISLLQLFCGTAHPW